jgi:hypothetical protein
MSDKLPVESKNSPIESRNNEELDLILLFNLIGNSFNKFYRFFAKIAESLYNVIILVLKAFFQNYKIIISTVLILAIVGYLMEKNQKDVFMSEMLVRPYFDSKYQLVQNINYYNALIKEKDYQQLENIFDISEDEAEDVLSFKITPGPETENDRIREFDQYVKSIDSLRVEELKVNFDDFIKNRSIYNGDLFLIEVHSHKKDIFRRLEEGLNSTFTNTYSVKKMQKRDSLLSIEKNRILRSLSQIDSLKRVYEKVIEEESKSDKGMVSFKDGMSVVSEKTKTKEYELLEKSIELQKMLSNIEAQKVEEDVYFDTLASFQDVGALYNSVWNKYSIIFPAFGFILLCLVYVFNRLYRYVIRFGE